MEYAKGAKCLPVIFGSAVKHKSVLRLGKHVHIDHLGVNTK